MRLSSPVWLIALALLAWPGCDTGDDDDTSADDDAGDDDAVADDDDSAGDDDDSAGDDDDTAADDDDTVPADPYIQPDIYVEPIELIPGGTATIHYNGVYAAADNLSIHYGFNGWNDVPGVAGLQEQTALGNTDFFIEAPMTPDNDGYQVVVDVPYDARAFHFVFYWEEDEQRHWDNNSSLDYHWSVVFPYIGPYLTWSEQDAPSHSVVVNFETSVPCLGTVEYGLTQALGTRVVGDLFGTQHNIALPGLLPGTQYHYRVEDSASQQSSIASFRTAPLDPSSYSFVVASDMQDCGDGANWATTAAEIEAGFPDAHFMTVPGDMACNDQPGQWWYFFDAARELLSGRVIMPMVGNHDTPGVGSNEDTESFERYFALPSDSGDSSYYRFNYGNAAFLALSTEDLDEIGDGGVQDLWLEQELFQLATTWSGDWAFALWHVAPYNAGERHSIQMGSVRQLVEHLEEIVDWQFSAHEHMYQRMLPLRHEGQIAPSGMYGRGADDGVGYIVMPPAGVTPNHTLVGWDSPEAHYRDWVDYPAITEESDWVESELGFLIVAIDGTSIEIQAYGLGTPDQPAPLQLRESLSYSK